MDGPGRPDARQEADPVRDAVYASIGRVTEDAIQREFLGGRGAAAVRRVIDGCWDAVMALPGGAGDGSAPSAEERQVRASAAATVLLHYLLTILLVPSQRKTVHDGVPVDVAIPDTRTLRTDWNSCLVVCILSSTDPAYVEGRMVEAGRIQPNRDNIWAVSPGPAGTGHKTFVMGPDGGNGGPDAGIPFQDMADAVIGFLDKAGSARLRLFRAV